MYKYTKRLFDILISFLILALLIPFFLIISFVILLIEGTPVFFLQERVGENWRNFKIIKFRTMIEGAEKLGSGISTHKDFRITKLGGFLRKFKIDELPQFINVLLGQMSIVGPRPELRKYAEAFKDQYSKILMIKPGISDYASIEFKNESELLKSSECAEEFYLQEILPKKIKLCEKYIKEMSLWTDFKIIFNTLKAIA